eukprot:TRINITY_DN20280_c0_g1_i1.p1 TRINITY_DN20280_c0_g1~~TRINITY_DN20280_c0_g1_i1.p1  ORF type:complete len:378 (-),score=105.92 TRINITY_DN20280_c0_g1_i1:622-1608(-)
MGSGGDSSTGEGSLAVGLAERVRPRLIAAVASARKAAFSAGADERRKQREGAQKLLEEVWGLLQLYCKGLEAFEAEAPVLPILHRHLLRTTASEAADILLRFESFEQSQLLLSSAPGLPAHSPSPLSDATLASATPSSSSPATPFSSGPLLSASERLTLAKSLPGTAGRAAVLLAEALEGKSCPVGEAALERCAEACGMRLRRLDKKAERALLHAHSKSLQAQLQEEADPVAALPLAVAFLFFKVHRRALNAPGRSLAAVITTLKSGLPEDHYSALSEYQLATVEFITARASAAATTDVDNEAEERLRLQGQLERLKALALPSGADAS